MYNDLNSHGDRAKEDRGSERRHAGTGGEISARIHVANSHGNRAEEGRRSDRKHSANSLWERDESCMSVGASIASQSSKGFNRSWKSIAINKKIEACAYSKRGRHPTQLHPWSLPQWDFCHV